MNYQYYIICIIHNVLVYRNTILVLNRVGHNLWNFVKWYTATLIAYIYIAIKSGDSVSLFNSIHCSTYIVMVFL